MLEREVYHTVHQAHNAILLIQRISERITSCRQLLCGVVRQGEGDRAVGRNGDCVGDAIGGLFPAAGNAAINAQIFRFGVGEMPARARGDGKVILAVHTDAAHDAEQPVADSTLRVVVQ